MFSDKTDKISLWNNFPGSKSISFHSAKPFDAKAFVRLKHLSGLKNHQFRRISFNFTRILLRGNFTRVDTSFFLCAKLFFAHQTLCSRTLCTEWFCGKLKFFPLSRQAKKNGTVQMHFPLSRENPFDWDFPLRNKKKRSKNVLCLPPAHMVFGTFSNAYHLSHPQQPNRRCVVTTGATRWHSGWTWSRSCTGPATRKCPCGIITSASVSRTFTRVSFWRFRFFCVVRVANFQGDCRYEQKNGCETLRVFARYKF